jgi:bisdemethoxycurcumin synthase
LQCSNNNGSFFFPGHKSAIKKRYFHHTEELLLGHPAFIDRSMPSLDERQAIMATAVPELAAAAAADAIAEWGRPATEITHLVVTTYSGAHMPGVDWLVASLLGLRPTVRRTMLYMNGCSSGCAALRLAKDMAENNRGARVLVACAELTLMVFRAPHEAQVDTLITQSLFGDGAGAVVVGADPVSVEEPEFEMVSASQTMIPESKQVASGQLSEDGLRFHPSREIPSLVRENVEQCMVDALSRRSTSAAAGTTSSGRSIRVAALSWTASRRGSGWNRTSWQRAAGC